MVSKESASPFAIRPDGALDGLLLERLFGGVCCTVSTQGREDHPNLRRRRRLRLRRRAAVRIAGVDGHDGPGRVLELLGLGGKSAETSGMNRSMDKARG